MAEIIDKLPIASRSLNGRYRYGYGNHAILKSMPVINLPEPKTLDTDPLTTLLTKIGDSDEAALEAFYELTVNRVYGLALRITTRPELAEEVVGDVFLQVWRKARHYASGRAAPMAWLLMICRSRAIDLLRRERPQKTGLNIDDKKSEILDEETPSPFDTLLGTEQGSQISRALEQLTDIQRQMISLAFFRGMSHQEVAIYTHQPLGTVKSHLRRAQAALRKTLADYGLQRENAHG